MNNVYGITVILYIKFYVNIIIMSVNNIVFWFVGIIIISTYIIHNGVNYYCYIFYRCNLLLFSGGWFRLVVGGARCKMQEEQNSQKLCAICMLKNGLLPFSSSKDML